MCIRDRAEAGVSLAAPLPGVTVKAASGSANAASTLTQLSNGVRVISENSPSHCTSMGVFVGAGSRNENEGNIGAAKFCEAMAFKTSEARSQFGFHNEVEKMGALVGVQSSREDIAYTAEVVSENTGSVLEIMAESVMNPLFLEHEINDEKPHLKARCADAMNNSMQVVTEAAHTAAFGNTGLGRSVAPSFSKLASLDSAALRDFHSAGFTAGNIVVAASGVDHAEFVKHVEASFGSLPAAPAPASSASTYQGGQYCLAGEPADGMTHVVLGFNGAGWKSDNLIAMCVLNTLMGGGGSFSAGGPGKGMYSRLYLQVLNRHFWVQNATAINSPYSDSGLFGVFGSAHSQDANALVQVLAEQLAGMAGPVSDEELSRAKAMTKSQVYMNLESRAITLEDLGKQVLCFGKRLSADDICNQIDALSAADLQKAAKAVISTPLTYSAYGETHSLPRYDVIANAIN
eukprot:TRINITY_DN26333_c0_g1_i1.p1 TRINITY_DN26333_c0_g1~~TRINITY_DN26333_c0_g1_i1.p1  ORF type:complete len:460 (+),score=124.90 TRINITY_DN26333_c0_g1_i1:182-1561(+)